MATIKDVAERARVSTATVSYVLNGTGTITAETRQRVLSAVAELNYQPNHAARSLRTRAHTLGLVLPPGPSGLDDPALAELVAGISEAAAAHGYYLLLAPGGARPEHELGADLARTGRVDGLVLLDLRVDDGRAAQLCAAGVPCVGAGSPAEGMPCPTVSLDLARGAADATRHLCALGHERIAMIALPSDLADSEPFYQGFAATLASAGRDADPALVVEAGTSQEDGLAAMQELLARPEPPTAVIAASDALAFGAMHALRDAGLEIGRDVSLVGCGDLPLAAHTHPPLTTLRAPRRAMGAALARRLIALVERRPEPPGGGLALQPGGALALQPGGALALQLIVRRSTSSPPGETRRPGDKESGRQGERETRRAGDKESGRQGEREITSESR